MQFLKQKPIPGDFWGGLAATAVVLPQAMAFGVTLLVAYGFTAAAGALSGLVAASLLCLLSGLVGGTRGLISSPTGSVLILLSGALAALSQQGVQGSALLAGLAAIVMGSGVFLILIGLSGGGKLIKYIPYPVTSGFMTGSALLMLLSQQRPLLAEDIIGGSSIPWLPALTAGVTALSTWLLPKVFSKLPGTIAGLLAGTLFFHVLVVLTAVDVPGYWMIGELPTLTSVDLVLDVHSIAALPWTLILVSALTLAVIISINTLLNAVLADVSTMARHNAHAELVAQGMGNLLSGAFGGMAASGTTGATLAAISSGGARWAAVATGVLLPLLLLVGNRIGTLLPISVLSGIMLYVAVRMLDLDILAWLRNPRTRSDAFIAILVTLITVTYDLMVAVAAGASIAIFLFVRSQILASVVHMRSTGKQLRSIRKRSQEESEALQASGEQIVLYELRGNLIFATADSLLDQVAPDLTGGKTIILHLRRVQQIDLTAARLLQQLATRLSKQGGMLLVCNLHQEIGLGELAEKALRQFSISAAQVPIRTFNGKDEALEFAENHLLESLGIKPANACQRVELADNDLCKAMTPDELQHLQRVLRPKTLQAGELLFQAGTEGGSLYLVLQGEIELRLPTTQHHYKRLANCQAGTYFGELALLNPGPRVASAIAIQSTELGEMTGAGLELLRKESPQAAIKLLMMLTRIEVEHLRWATRELQHLSEW
jgi:SulP family sulfate permease